MASWINNVSWQDRGWHPGSTTIELAVQRTPSLVWFSDASVFAVNRLPAYSDHRYYRSRALAAGAGLPAAGAELSATGAGLLAAGAGLPAAGAELSATGAGLPAAGAELSATGAGLPAAGAGLPAAGAELPAAGAGQPTTGIG